MKQINLFQHATSIQDRYYRNSSNADLHLAPTEPVLFLQADDSNCSSEWQLSQIKFVAISYGLTFEMCKAQQKSKS